MSLVNKFFDQPIIAFISGISKCQVRFSHLAFLLSSFSPSERGNVVCQVQAWKMDSGILTNDIYIQVVHEHQIHQILQVLPATFLYWDHTITLGSEIRYVWSHPKSRGSRSFLFLRYLGMFSNITVLVLGSYPLSNEGCNSYSLYRQILLLILQTVISILLTLRIHAIFGCDNRVLMLLCGSAIALIGMVAYMLVRQKSIPYPIQIGCHIGLSVESAHRLVGAWIACFVYETIQFLLMASRTFRYYFWQRSGELHIPLFSLMFRDGAMYFGVMALATLSNILTFYLCGPFMRGGLSSFTSCLSVTLTCRLMLNLYATADKACRPGIPCVTPTNIPSLITPPLSFVREAPTV